MECGIPSWKKASSRKFYVRYVAVAAFTFLSFAAICVSRYLIGRYLEDAGLWMAVKTFAWLAAMFSSSLLGSMLLIAILCERQLILRTAILFGLLISVWACLPTTKLFLYGFQNRLLASVSAADLRTIRDAVKDLPSPHSDHYSPLLEIRDGLADDPETWRLLKQSSSAGSLPLWPSLVIWRDHGDVILQWGSTLMGDWALEIGKSSIVDTRDWWSTYRIDDDIVLGYASNR